MKFECDECGRKFTSKQGRTRHKTVTHKKERFIKRERSVQEKNNFGTFKCDFCNYTYRSKWALKAHMNHKHKEPTSPNEKKPKIATDLVNNILSGIIENIDKEENTLDNKKMTTIEPTQDFLTNTAKTLAEMLEDVSDHIEVDEDENEEMEELEDRLDILRGDEPRNNRVTNIDNENTLITLPLKDVEELRNKLRNLEDVNEELIRKSKLLETTNKELVHKVEVLKEKNKMEEIKKNTDQAREELITIDMETNNEVYDIGQLVTHKENGYSRSSPQSEPQKKREVTLFECSECDKKFNKKEHMIKHQKSHEVTCSICEKLFKNSRLLQHHVSEHDEMICHYQCERDKCTREETETPKSIITHKCNFCEMAFPSKNTLATHRRDVHKSFKPCRDIANCQYQVGCYFSHIPITSGMFRCYQCGEEFNSKNTMMIHRKIHGGVKDCSKFVNNRCDRGDGCWWNHTINNQVFQTVTENLPPPIQVKTTPNIILVNMLKTMETELMKIKVVLNME